MGPSFHLGKTKIGRNRLPPNYVAILDDPALLLGALREMHAYALAPPTRGPKIRQSIIFRVVEKGELENWNYKLQDLLGAANFRENAAVFHICEGHWHVVDSEHVAHVCNRHSDVDREAQKGHIPVSALDFERLPDVISVRNIVACSVTKAMPRIEYRKRYVEGELTVIEEIRSRDVVVKTMYKRK